MILVTGGSGFIGSVLAKTLFELGFAVRIFDLIDFPDRPQEIGFVQGDIQNESDIKKALDGIDIIYHCVALVPLAKAGKKFWDVNVLGTEKLLNACKQKKIQHFIHLSSSTVFGIPECPISNKTNCKPVEIYGHTKLAGEKLVLDYIQWGGRASIIRPRTVLGNFRLGIFDILFEWVSENRKIYIIGDGENLFQFIHVQDLCDAMINASHKMSSGVYNIGTDRYSTLKQDLNSFISAVGSTSVICSIPRWIAIPTLMALDYTKLSPLAPWHYLSYDKPFYFNIENEMKLLDWKPKYSNIEMFVASYNWHRDYKNALQKNGIAINSTHHMPVKQKILKLLKWIS